MVFDPATVDLSFVEPALRGEVLRRITVLERFLTSRGRMAELAACRELGITRHQLHVLTRAWTSRRRAEDVTLRATKRRRPSNLDPDLIVMIGAAADEMPGASIREIEAEVTRRASDAGIAPPSYPTINKYVRERSHVRAAEVFAAVKADLVMDVIVSDIPTIAETGERVRPHLTLAFSRHPDIWPLALAVTTDMIVPADLAELLTSALREISLTESDRDNPRTSKIIVSVPAGALDDIEMVRLAVPGLRIETRVGELAVPGRLANAALGTSLAGYKLRPKLIGTPRLKRAAGYPMLAAATPADAATYLLTTARDGRVWPETAAL